MSSRTPRRTQSSLSNTPSNSSATLPPQYMGGDPQDPRKRQTKRDEAIRRKIENDLKKKKIQQMASSPTKQSKKAKGSVPGTVLSLKPSEPIICKPNITVYEASQIMSLKKENCVLVVDDSEELLGIFTAKDLAFRVVGSNLNANVVTIDQIMTPQPMCCKTSTLASDALNLMVSKGFRHLPIVNELNQLVGVLDITKCYNEAMVKLERMYENSKKLQDALEGVSNEIGTGSIGSQSFHIIQYFENLKNLIEGPTLNDMLDESTIPVYIDIKATAYDAAILMKEHRTTAVLVKDSKNNDEVNGIFTSKDVVLRVIAAGLDPKTCTVIRVMTPKPDYASSELSIHQALRKMFDGRYLNLPVIDEGSSEIIGIVEVLKLTYATLDQIKSMQTLTQGSSDSEKEEGPAWNKFWTSLDNDSESLHSVNSDHLNTAPFDITNSEIAQFNVTGDIGPSDSVSGTGMPPSKVESSRSDQVKESEYNNTYQFKFKSPNGRVHRLNFKPSDGYTSLRAIILSKFNRQELSQFRNDDNEELEFAISYVDDEGDIVAITNDADLVQCTVISSKLKRDKTDLLIHLHDEEPVVADILSKKSNLSEDELFGIPSQLLLPTAVFALAASIVVVFSLNRR